MGKAKTVDEAGFYSGFFGGRFHDWAIEYVSAMGYRHTTYWAESR